MLRSKKSKHVHIRADNSLSKGSLGGRVIQTSFLMIIQLTLVDILSDKQMDSDVFEIFRQYTKRYAELTDQELERIESACIQKKLRKHQYLLQEGEIWRYHAFIASGCLRTFSVDEKVVEHIVNFGISNWWVGDLESLKSNQPSKFNIDAVSDSKVVLFPDHE